MALRVRKEASFENLKTQIEAIQMHSKEKAKLEDEKLSNEASKDVDWKLVRAV